MILIGIGANLPNARFGGPLETCAAALETLAERGVRVVARSRWYRSAPVPASDQPWYVNGVAAVATELAPAPLLAMLHEIERDFGRVRGRRNQARILDLDLLSYRDRVEQGPPILPHPRLHLRAFVLLPLGEVAPGWRHPGSGRTPADMIADLPGDQTAVAIADERAGLANIEET